MGHGITVIDRLWRAHVVAELGNGRALLHIDRIFLHERTGPAVLEGLAAGVPLIDIDDARQGIVHVVAPEQGLVLPGMTLVWPDSHTGTVGGLGALAWGIGSTECEHAVATQSLVRAAAPRLQVRFDGVLPAGVGAKDMALEFGAWTALVAPDDTVFEWVAGRPHAPRSAAFDRSLAHWRTLRSDDDAAWDAALTLDVSQLAPQITWGTSPEHGGAINGRVPDPATQPDPGRRAAWEGALRYMDLQPGALLQGTPIDAAFIGSCTNARLSDLRVAAKPLRGRKVAAGVKAIVVPGSMPVRAAAEAEGLHRVFQDAGFEWRLSGCSLCFFSGGDSFGFAEGSHRRAISSTNHNFEGRQGPGVRTHIASARRLRCQALRTLALHRAGRARERRLFFQPTALAAGQHPDGRREFRLRFVARNSSVGTGAARHPLRHCTQLRRHLPRQLHPQRSAAGDTVRPRRGRAGGSCHETARRLACGLENLHLARAWRQHAPLHHRRPRTRAIARRPRRHRPDPAAPRGHRSFRGR